MQPSDNAYAVLVDARVHEPERIAQAYATRRRRSSLTRDGMMFIVAADHTARGMVGLGADRLAMANRCQMLDNLLVALDHPRVDGVLASADIMDDLVLLGVLDDRVAVGTMNRGGLAGVRWTLDDRFTAYDTAHLVGSNLDAGKMLLRDGGRPADRWWSASSNAARIWNVMDAACAHAVVEIEVPSLIGRSVQRLAWAWTLNALSLVTPSDTLNAAAIDLGWLGAPVLTAIHVAAAEHIGVDHFVTADGVTAPWATMRGLDVITL